MLSAAVRRAGVPPDAAIFALAAVGFAAAVAFAGAVLPRAAAAAPPPARVAALGRGVNITGWFRFPASRDPAILRGWLSDQAIAGIHAAGFRFARLAVDPDLASDPAVRAVLIESIRRLQAGGLAVVIVAHPNGWRLEDGAADQDKLLAFWRAMGPLLRRLPAGRTFPEPMNEPVFAHASDVWWSLQHRLLLAIRADLPDSTIILTGNDWGGIAGLLALPPEPDGNVIYSIHFYDPAELTSLAAWHPGLDRAALARLPFPAPAVEPCVEAAAAQDRTTAGVVGFYCGFGWDAVRVRAHLRRAADWASAHHAVLLAGEFGASDSLNPAARLAWLRLVRQTFESQRIGWALWGYDDSMGLNVPRPPPSRPVLNPSVLDALGLGPRRKATPKD